MAKGSDIIKIGFDYRSSLEQFEKETNGVFDGISAKAGKQRISIQLDAKNDKVIEKIKELQKLKLDKFTFEFGESGLAEQLKTFDQLEKKINEIINLSKGITSAISKTDFSTKNKTEAYSQLKQMADVFKNFYGNEEAMHSKAGTDAAYAYYKAYEEALQKGVAQSKLEKVTVDVEADGFFDAYRLSSDRIKEFDNFKKYGGDITDLSLEISDLEQRLLKFRDAYSQVESNLGEAPITPEIIKNIESYVRALEVAENRTKDADLFGFTKEDLESDKDYANMYLGFALEDATRENEKYVSSLQEVREEKEKTDEVLTHSSTSTINDSQFDELKADVVEIREELNGVKEKISVIDSDVFENIKSDVEKTTESVKELNSELTEIKSKLDNTSPIETNISSEKPTTPIKKDDLDNIDDLLDDLLLEDGFIEELIGDLEEEAEATKKASQADEEYIETKKKLNSLLEGMGLNPELDDELSKENGLLKEQSQEVIEIENALNILTDRYVKLTNIIQSASSGWDGISDSIKQALIQLKLFDETGKFLGNFNEQGMVAQGAVMNGTHAIIARRSETYDRNDTSLYNYGTDDYLDLLIKKEQEAYDKGVSLARILSVVEGYDGIYEIQEQAKGNQVHDIARYSTLESYLEKCKIVTEATDEQLEKLLQDVITLNNLGFKLDFGVGNILYDKENGFSLIDLELREIDEKVPETQDLIRNLFKSLSGGELMEKYTNSGISNFISEDNLQRLNAMLSVAQRLQTVFDVSKVPYFDAIVNAQKEVSANLSKTTIEDVFQNDSDSSSTAKEEVSAMEQVESATEQAVQAKKDFATANEGVQDSVADSKSPLQLEAELMQQIAKDARDAADAKKEFVDANKQVKDSADDSNGSVKKKGSKNENQKTVDKALTEQITAWKKIQSIREQIEKTKDSNNKTELENIQKYYQEQYDSAKSILSANQDLYDTEKQINKIKQIELETEAKISKYRANQKDSTVSSFQSSIDSYQSKLTKYNNRPKEKQSVEYQNLLTEYENQLARLKERAKELSEEEIISKDQINSFNELKGQLDKTDLKFQNVFKGDDLISVKKEIDTITQYMSKNTRISSEAKDKLRGYIEELKTKGVDANVKAIHAAFLDVCDGERKAKREGQSFLDVLRDKVWYQWAAQIGSYFSFNDIINYGKQAVETIVELDTALVDLKKTTAMSSSQMEDFYFDANDVAKEMGTTTKEIIEQASAWSRLGYNTKEAATEMAKLSSKFATISPGMDTDTAQEGLVSIMKAWGIGYEDVESEILDKINILGNNFAEENQDIVEGMERSAAALAAVGTSYTDAFALFTGAQEVLQNAEKTGTAIRSVALRLRSFDEETEEVSEDLANITGELADLTKTAEHSQGVSIFKEGSTTEFKSLVDYFGEISDIWGEMSQKQQNDYLIKAFGRTQAQAGAALIQNYDAVKDSIAMMEQSAGKCIARIYSNIYVRIYLIAGNA